MSSSKRPYTRFSAEQVTEILMSEGSGDESSLDGETGSLSRGEEFDLYQAIINK